MKVNKVVIPVAGKGTRFLPATKEIPKEMLPILKKPMIHYVVEEAVLSGISKVIFVTSSGKESIENYFDKNIELETFLASKSKNTELESIRHISDMVEIVSTRQKEQLGLGHAIMCSRDIVGDENFAVILGDDIVLSKTPVLKQLIDESTRTNHSSVIGVMNVPADKVDKYGIIRGDFIENSKTTLLMKEMVEKPDPKNTPSTLATPGRYLLTPSIFKYLEEIPKGIGGEYQLTDAINLMAQKENVYAHIFEGDRFDTGSIEGYLDATVEFALRDKNLNNIMMNIIKEKIEKYNI